MKLEPLGYIGKESVAALQGGESQVTGTICNPRHFRDDVALYAIPDGYVVVPVELIKEARRIVARAYADGNSASIRHYNCMTALDRLVDWKDGEECILPDEPR